MTTSEALVATGRADRYLEQFASHFAHQPGGIQAQLDGEGRLLVDFGGATCSMEATADGLVLHAEAAGAAELGQLQRRLAERLEQIGRRDGIAVLWSPDFSARHHRTPVVIDATEAIAASGEPRWIPGLEGAKTR